MSFLFLQSLTIFAGGDAVLLNEEAAEVSGRESYFFGNGVDGLAGLVLEETAGLGEADGVDVGGEGEASGVVGKELVSQFFVRPPWLSAQCTTCQWWGSACGACLPSGTR